MQNAIKIINIILLIGVVQGIIFTTIIFKKKENKALQFLSLIVLFLSLNNLQAWLVEKDLIKINYYIDYLHVSWNIFLAPLFYLFLVHYLQIEHKRLKNIFIVTIFIFLVTILFRLFSLYYVKGFVKTDYFLFYLRKHNINEDIFVFLYTVPIFMYGIYLFYRQKSKFKFVESYDNLEWIRFFFKLSSIILLLWLLAILLNYALVSDNPTSFYLPLRLGTSFLIYWLGYQGFTHSRLLQDRILLREELRKNKTTLIKNKYNLTGLKEFNRIENEIVKIKYFLDPYLSLNSLADKLKTNTNYLSKLINTHSAFSFTEYINKFRVSYAKELLSNKKYANYTIISIGLESGFNSKSAFYAAFKKFTKQTPSEFRKKDGSSL